MPSNDRRSTVRHTFRIHILSPMLLASADNKSCLGHLRHPESWDRLAVRREKDPQRYFFSTDFELSELQTGRNSNRTAGESAYGQGQPWANWEKYWPVDWSPQVGRRELEASGHSRRRL